MGERMNRYAIVAVAGIVLCGCARGQQNQKVTATNTTSEDAAATPLTMVGCLVPANETKEGRAVGTGGNAPPPIFTLVNVSSPVSGSARSYLLVAKQDRLDDLQRFSNSRVEVTGSIVAATASDASDVKRLRVTDVRQIEPTCGVAKKE